MSKDLNNHFRKEDFQTTSKYRKRYSIYLILQGKKILNQNATYSKDWLKLKDKVWGVL